MMGGLCEELTCVKCVVMASQVVVALLLGLVVGGIFAVEPEKLAGEENNFVFFCRSVCVLQSRVRPLADGLPRQIL